MVKKKQSLADLRKEVSRLKNLRDKEIKRKKDVREAEEERKNLEIRIKRLKQSPLRKSLRSENLAKTLNKINESGLGKAFKKRGRIILRNLENAK